MDQGSSVHPTRGGQKNCRAGAGRPDVLAAISLCNRIGVEIAHEGFECEDVAPRARAEGGVSAGGERRGRRKESRAGLAQGKNAHTAQAILREVPRPKSAEKSGERRRTRRPALRSGVHWATGCRVVLKPRANAGKTTILQRVCDTTGSPIVYRGGKEVTLDPSIDLTLNMNQRLGGDSHRWFIVDCNTKELGILQAFIRHKCGERRLRDRLHAIWFGLQCSRVHDYGS
ncbi:hypothetical protein EDB89DRAFT_1908274 [Lactarius sanguifluus]|nr:hypothetical protein EDB89DRAFT_1908274 [Lactarius sanguifluus]